ncbi:MAG: glycine zipper 2TM domain-containing protein [Pseudomonadota bacterium]
MHTVNSIKSGLALTALVIGLTACSREPAATAATPAAAVHVTVAEPAAPRPVVVVCQSCGVVSSISAVRQEGTGTGVGAVIGGIVGGLAGNQVGGGSGKKVATVAGVIGGAVVGNKIEGNRNDSSWYEVTVAMDAGGQRSVTIDNAAAMGIGVGSKVSVSGNTIALR